MRLIIKRPAPQAADPLDFGSLSQSRLYRLKSRSFVLSVLVHGAIVTALLLQKNLPGAQAATGQPIYETLIKPQEKKIIWYHFKNDLPNIDSSTTHVKEGPNTGKIRSPRTVIAQSKNGSKDQFVWQDTPVELPTRVKAPNLIALHPPAALESKPLPPPPAPKHKDFVAPPPQAPAPQPPQPAALPLPSAPYAGANPQVPVSLPSVLESGQMKVYRPFVAPPGQKSGNGNSPGTGTTGTDPLAPPDAPNVGQGSNLNMAAINLNPILGNSTLPPGRRQGDFSAGPNVGEPSAERSGRGTAMVPGLTTRGNNTGDSEPNVKIDPSIPKREIVYREVMTHPMGSSMSVPLWPGARRIPPALDLQFRNKPVYTMILPAPKMPQYAGDWVLWFSELKPSENAVQIRSPLPDKKLVADLTSAGTAWGAEVDVRINLVIDETGHVQSLSIAKAPPDASPQMALDDVRAWQFKPATRNGVAIAVEAVLDIPFRKMLAGQPK